MPSILGNLTLASGFIQNAGDQFACAAGGAALCYVAGVYNGGTIAFYVTNDNVTFSPITVYPTDGSSPVSSVTLTQNQAKSWFIPAYNASYLVIQATTNLSGALQVSVRSDQIVTVGNSALSNLISQTSLSAVLQENATADGNGSVATVDGYDGTLNLLIANGAGSGTVTVEGSYDNFQTPQNIATLGVIPLWDSNDGVITNRTLQAGIIPVAANTSYTFMLTELYPYIRTVISNASSLGAGSTLTGCTTTLYAVPV